MLEISAFVFEIPTSVVADLYSRSSLTTIGLVSWAERRLDVRSRATLARALTGVVLAIAAGATFLALIGHLWIALALFIFLPALRGLVGPLETAWINQLIDSRSRATVISMHGQADALGQTAAGPTVGWGALHFGLGPAIATAALALVPAAWLYRRAGNNAPGAASSRPAPRPTDRIVRGCAGATVPRPVRCPQCSSGCPSAGKAAGHLPGMPPSHPGRRYRAN